jgi:hypothetical protein
VAVGDGITTTTTTTTLEVVAWEVTGEDTLKIITTVTTITRDDVVRKDTREMMTTNQCSRVREEIPV